MLCKMTQFSTVCPNEVETTPYISTKAESSDIISHQPYEQQLCLIAIRHARISFAFVEVMMKLEIRCKSEPTTMIVEMSCW